MWRKVLFCYYATLPLFTHAKGACHPTTLIMTRATGSAATMQDDVFAPEYPLNGVDLANVHGALKYVMTETIDLHTGITNNTKDGWCKRKNGVQYIHFYQVTFCNTNEALWWFNPSRPSGYFGELGYDFKLFGDYLTFDGGVCHDNINCKKLHGNDNTPALHSWVGFQHQANDPRNPTDDAYWFSVPGDCPLRPWNGENAKDDACIQAEPSGRCENNDALPDGESCSWTSTFLGQVNLDHLVGITSMINPVTNSLYVDYNEYCLSSGVEFERDADDYSMLQGLSFYDSPTDREANAKRVEILLSHYENTELYPHNVPIPTFVDNAPCYKAVRNCGDGGVGSDTRICKRDDSQVCLYCKEGTKVFCETDLPSNWKHDRFPKLDSVSFPADSDAGDSLDEEEPTESKDGNALSRDELSDNGNKLKPFLLVLYAVMVLVMV